MSEHTEAPKNESNVLHVALFLLGGLCVGTGLLELYWAFGWSAGALNSNFRAIGFSGLDNISALSTAPYAIPLVIVGLACLIYGNAIAWRHTEGY